MWKNHLPIKNYTYPFTAGDSPPIVDDVNYLPDRNQHLGGTIQFAYDTETEDYCYQFPIEADIDLAEDILSAQADEHGDGLSRSTHPQFELYRTEDRLFYDLGYKPDTRDDGEYRIAFIARRKPPRRIEAIYELSDIRDQTGLDAF